MVGTTPSCLSKHHAAGNDFLVHLDEDGRGPFSSAEVAALCHRHFGVGADGLLQATAGTGGADLRMELRNADGSEAEMSGNGIRCLVQAAVDAGWVRPGVVEVDTAAGRRRVEYSAGAEPATGYGRVGMGPVRLGPELDALVGALTVGSPDGPVVTAAREATVGNPHVVLLLDGPLGGDDVRSVGSRLDGSAPDGVNVEFAWVGSAPGELVMRVWERGVGETLACGTGACASAAAAGSWGIAGGGEGHDTYIVHNPGGALEVRLGPDGAVLGGPTVTVAEIVVDEESLAAMTALVSEQVAASS